ncbi:MAG: metallophosphoesterase, partial [Candidatus Diapherotrites archaeon]|nr:metallophosphoesterase [Candidatus Diapherotrites archaeon]
MRIGIFSDCHFGFAEGQERASDALDMAVQAMQGVLEKGVDAVLLAGDLFDTNEPSPEAFAQAFECFGFAAKKVNPGTSATKVSRDSTKRVFDFMGVPLLSIHGTHEHRPKGLVNALEVLETAGALVHIHANAVVLKSGDEQVVVQGLSGVPEKVAKEVLMQWNPKPIMGAFNILVLHQSFSEFLPTDDEM